MGILKAIILAIVEGITEFLPISSTGHLIILEEIIKLSDNKNFTTSFEVIIQFGAILSVIIYFWKYIWPFSGNENDRKEKWNMWLKIIVAFLPAAIIGLLFEKKIEQYLFNSFTVSLALIFFGIVIILIEFHMKNNNKRIDNINDISYSKAFLIGIFQCLAMIPGTSRSAATIIGGLLLGLNRIISAEFSFFLAIPTIFGASMLKVIKNGLIFTSYEWLLIIIGFITSFIVAWIVIALFMNYIKRRSFSVFGYYRIILGIIILLLYFLKK